MTAIAANIITATAAAGRNTDMPDFDKDNKKKLEELIASDPETVDADDDEGTIDTDDDVVIEQFTDEDGNEVALEHLDDIPYKGKVYSVFIGTEEDDDEVYILRREETEGEYGAVLDQEIVDAVFDLFKDRWSDTFDFA